MGTYVSLFRLDLYSWTNQLAYFTTARDTWTAGEWYCATFVGEGTTGKAYVNGQLDNTRQNLPYPYLSTYTSNLYIGSYNGICAFDGTIAEVQISKTARSAAWVKAMYNASMDDLLTFNTLQSAPVTYTWDDNGNLLTRSDRLAFTYDTKDFTTSITPPGGSAISMTYTGTDQTQRIQKGSITYKYDDKAIGPTVQTSGSATYFTTNPGGGLVGLRHGNDRYYYIFDGLGSVVGLTNSSGTVVNTYSYDPYGNILSQSETVAQPFKFASVYYDSEYSLYKMGARYYDPSTGRFTQADPIALPNPTINEGMPWFIQLCRSGQNTLGALANTAFNPTEMNFFVYAGNDPVNGTDLTGYWNAKKFWAGLGCVVFGALCLAGSYFTFKVTDILSGTLLLAAAAEMSSMWDVIHGGELLYAHGIVIGVIISPGVIFIGLGGLLMWQGLKE